MITKRLSKVAARMLFGLACAAVGFAQVTISVDMDASTPGIQSTRSTLGPFTAGLVMSVPRRRVVVRHLSEVR